MSVLDGCEIDDILKTIGSFDLLRDGDESLSNKGISSISISNFGVFRLDPAQAQSCDGDSIQDNTCLTSSEGAGADVDVDLHVDVDLPDAEEIIVEDDSDTLIVPEHSWPLVTGQHYGTTDAGSDTVTRAASSLWDIYAQHSTIDDTQTNPNTLNPSHCYTSSSNRSPSSLAVYSPPPFSDTQASVPTSIDFFTVPLQERYLLRYYIEKVVQLSCVVDNEKSPWKTIHLPRALQGIGQLSVQGTTSGIRNALKSDLLSISAFQLSNHHRFLKNKDEASRWFRAASQYRCDAIGLLKLAMERDLYSQSHPKYKDFLATMLSMISINVSGYRCR